MSYLLTTISPCVNYQASYIRHLFVFVSYPLSISVASYAASAYVPRSTSGLEDTCASLPPPPYTMTGSTLMDPENTALHYFVGKNCMEHVITG